MAPVKEQLFNVVDFISEPKLTLLLEIAKCFADDDIATPEDIAAIAAARKEYEAGETTNIKDINWD